MDLLGFAGCRMTVKAMPGASKRTKNRIRENGPIFTFIKKGRAESLHPDSVLLRSERTNWFGWLPTHEVIMAHTPDSTSVDSKLDQTKLYNQ